MKMMCINNSVRRFHLENGDLLFFHCQKCNRKLKVSQILKKDDGFNRTFNLYVFYCRKCRTHYLIFKIIEKNKKERGKNE